MYHPRVSLKQLLKENKYDYIFVTGNRHFAVKGGHDGNKYPIVHIVVIKKGTYNIFKADNFYIFDRINKKSDGLPSETAYINNFFDRSFVPEFTKDLVTQERDLTVLGEDSPTSGGGPLTRLYFKFTNDYKSSYIDSYSFNDHYSKVKANQNNFYILATNIPQLMDLQDKDIHKYIPIKPVPPTPTPIPNPSPSESGGSENVDLTKINEKIGKLDNLDKLSFLEKIYKECVAIKDKISNLDILKNILEYLKKILYENQKTNDYFSTLMKSLDFDKHKVDNSNFKELLKFLQKFKEDLLQDMANLDRDGDHPDLSAIYDINSNILSKLNDFMPSGILPKILNAIESLNINVGSNFGRLNDNLAVIVRVIGGGGGSGGSTTGGGGSGDTSNNFISSVTNITNNIKNLAGSEEQAKKDLDDLKDNMQKFVNQEPFGSGREAEEALKKFKIAKPSKTIPTYGIEPFKGVTIPAMDFGPFLGIIADIRKILVAMLWISLFLYLVRVFIPKLKV